MLVCVGNRVIVYEKREEKIFFFILRTKKSIIICGHPVFQLKFTEYLYVSRPNKRFSVLSLYWMLKHCFTHRKIQKIIQSSVKMRNYNVLWSLVVATSVFNRLFIKIYRWFILFFLKYYKLFQIFLNFVCKYFGNIVSVYRIKSIFLDHEFVCKIYSWFFFVFFLKLLYKGKL